MKCKDKSWSKFWEMILDLLQYNIIIQIPLLVYCLFLYSKNLFVLCDRGRTTTKGKIISFVDGDVKTASTSAMLVDWHQWLLLSKRGRSS